MAPIAVPYHRQLGTTRCGAACLLMVLEALGEPSRTQETLYDDSHEHGEKDPESAWWSPPDGVEWALEHRSALSKAAVELAAFTSEMSLTRRIVWSLFQHSIPPIVLVGGKNHWLVIVNYDITANPTGPSDSSYTIRALEYHDPWRTVEDPDPPPPPPPTHITLEAWLTDDLLAVPDGYWQGKRVAIGVFGE
jgi:hypothetical protein